MYTNHKRDDNDDVHDDDYVFVRRKIVKQIIVQQKIHDVLLQRTQVIMCLY